MGQICVTNLFQTGQLILDGKMLSSQFINLGIAPIKIFRDVSDESVEALFEHIQGKPWLFN